MDPLACRNVTSNFCMFRTFDVDAVVSRVWTKPILWKNLVRCMKFPSSTVAILAPLQTPACFNRSTTRLFSVCQPLELDLNLCCDSISGNSMRISKPETIVLTFKQHTLQSLVPHLLPVMRHSTGSVDKPIDKDFCHRSERQDFEGRACASGWIYIWIGN